MQFNDSNKIGKRGEAVVKAMLEAELWFVMDVSDSKYFQSIDVDYVLQKSGKTRMVDVKCDRHPPRNFAIEIVSNDTKGTEGCIYATRADYWMYYFEETQDLFIFDPKDMIEYIEENSEGLRLIKHPTRSPYNRNDIWYHSHCYLVPIEDVVHFCKYRDLKSLIS